jgi:hypothetical protein
MTQLKDLSAGIGENQATSFAHPTFAEIRQRIDRAADLSATAKRDLASAINRVIGRWLGQDVETTRADPAQLREQMSMWTAARFGVSDATFRTVRSQLNRALRAAGVKEPREAVAALSHEWQALDQALSATWAARRRLTGKPIGQNWLQIRLRRFMRWCSARQVRPRDVCDETFAGYMQQAAQSALRGDPTERDHGLRKAWNSAASHVPGWPSALVRNRGASNARPAVSMPETAFPASFRAELDRFERYQGVLPTRSANAPEPKTYLERLRLKRAAQLDANVPDRPRRRLRPLSAPSIAKLRWVLRLTASALVSQGLKPAKDIRAIADVASLEGAACLIDALAARQQQAVGKTPYASALIAMLLSVIARCRLELAAEDVAALHELAGELAGSIEVDPNAMTARNRERLSQFDDADAFAMVVSCPEWELDRLERERRSTGQVTIKMAWSAEAAIALLIMCALPLRRRTLVTTDWRRNIRPPIRRGGPATLIYHPDQSKTRRPFQVVLEPWKWRLIELFWKHYRPVLGGAASNFLFPGATPAGHKTDGKLAGAVVKLIRRRTGLVVHLHLLRHILGTKLLEEHKDVRLVEELLGHAPGSRATQRYAEMQIKWSAQRLDAITDRTRGRGLHLHRQRDRRVDRRALTGHRPIAAGAA